MVILIMLLVLLVAWLVSNYVAWAATYRNGDPYNWRIFLGPWVYTNWLDKRYEK